MFKYKKLTPLLTGAAIGGAGLVAGSYLERKFNIQSMLLGQQQYKVGSSSRNLHLLSWLENHQHH